MNKTKNIGESFYHAGQGLVHCLKNERNIRVHLTMAIVALVLGVALDINHYEFLVLLLLIAVVIVSEMINTAIENVVDMITEDFHPLAKVVKDITAGAVMFSCIVAVCIGLIIFIPHIIELFT